MEEKREKREKKKTNSSGHCIRRHIVHTLVRTNYVGTVNVCSFVWIVNKNLNQVRVQNLDFCMYTKSHFGENEINETVKLN